jgi:hypothetical protein
VRLKRGKRKKKLALFSSWGLSGSNSRSGDALCVGHMWSCACVLCKRRCGRGDLVEMCVEGYVRDMWGGGTTTWKIFFDSESKFNRGSFLKNSTSFPKSPKSCSPRQ